MRNLLVTIAFVPLLANCGGGGQDDRVRVDTLLHNGKVVTIDANLSIASAVAVRATSVAG